MLMVENLFMLLFGHALADFVLQPEAMGYGKNRNDKIHDKKNSLFPRLVVLADRSCPGARWHCLPHHQLPYSGTRGDYLALAD